MKLSMEKAAPGYPDIDDILRRKAQGRRDIVGRSFGEKIAMLEALRERLMPFQAARRQEEEPPAKAPGDVRP